MTRRKGIAMAIPMMTFERLCLFFTISLAYVPNRLNGKKDSMKRDGGQSEETSQNFTAGVVNQKVKRVKEAIDVTNPSVRTTSLAYKISAIKAKNKGIAKRYAHIFPRLPVRMVRVCTPAIKITIKSAKAMPYWYGKNRKWNAVARAAAVRVIAIERLASWRLVS